MISTTAILQVIIALGLLNVWIVRFNKETDFRGGKAKNLQEEFAAYGLPTWFCYAIGSIKVLSAIALILGFWVPELVRPASIVVAALMIGALAMHLKIKDPVKKSIPAFCMLALSGLVYFL